MIKDNIFIFAGGKSSRFDGNPKILETFEYNKKLLNKYFNVFIVTSKEIYEKIKHLNTNFIIQDMGYGSGQDVYNLLIKLNSPAFICWSDVFFNEDNIKDIISASKNENNCMTGTKRENAYVSLSIKRDKLFGYKYNTKGIQDNSIFYIKELKFSSKEFMDMAIKNDFYVYETITPSKFFNTKQELIAIKGLI